MLVKKEINKHLLINLASITAISVVIYYVYAVINIGYRWIIPSNITNILQYFLCIVSSIQLLAVYGIIGKVIFVPSVVSKLSVSIEEANDPLLKKYSSEEATIIKGCKITFDQNYIFIIYGLTLAVLGADNITFSSFLLLAILVLCVIWFWVNYKIDKYFKK